MISQPKELSITLYDHQLLSIKKMEQLELEKKIVKKDCIKEVKLGINADPTGYGQTLSTIGLLIKDKSIFHPGIILAKVLSSIKHTLKDLLHLSIIVFKHKYK